MQGAVRACVCVSPASAAVPLAVCSWGSGSPLLPASSAVHTRDVQCTSLMHPMTLAGWHFFRRHHADVFEGPMAVHYVLCMVGMWFGGCGVCLLRWWRSSIAAHASSAFRVGASAACGVAVLCGFARLYSASAPWTGCAATACCRHWVAFYPAGQSYGACLGFSGMPESPVRPDLRMLGGVAAMLVPTSPC